MHQICHSDEKQFSCKECDFQTRRIESLKNHMRIHRNERRFECDICFKKFTLSNGLRVSWETFFDFCLFSSDHKLQFTRPKKYFWRERP